MQLSYPRTRFASEKAGPQFINVIVEMLQNKEATEELFECTSAACSELHEVSEHDLNLYSPLPVNEGRAETTLASE